MFMHYGKQEYWDEQYSVKKDAFDWYLRFSDIKELLISYFKPQYKFLYVGCGTSKIADELLQIGCDQVLNIDYSYPLVKHMTDKTSKDYNPKLEYLCMDVRKMDLQNEVFDIVLDKGTFDCMMCADTSQKHMKEYLSQIFRVLCEGGSYIMVSYGEPPSREKYLRLIEKSEKLVFEVDPKKKLKEPPVYFIYICTKMTNREIIHQTGSKQSVIEGDLIVEKEIIDETAEPIPKINDTCEIKLPDAPGPGETLNNTSGVNN